MTSQSRLEFERLISDTSASLFAVPIDQVDAAVERALERVRIFFGMDRSGLLSVSPDQQAVTLSLASYGEGISHVPGDIDLATLFPWQVKTLVCERTPIRVSSIADLPPEANVERANWIQMQIRSALIIPVETRGTVSHLIALNAVHRECEWPDDFISRLRVLGEMLVSALDRQAMFARLREAEERMNLAADSAEAGLWSLDFGTGRFWLTERARALFEFLPDEVVDLERLEATIHPEDRDAVRNVIERSRQEPEPVELEYRIVLADGSVRWFASRGGRISRPPASPSE